MDTDCDSFQIDGDAPPPEARIFRNGFSSAVQETLIKMKIGDSFWVHRSDEDWGRSGMVRTVAKRLGVKVVQRKTGDKKYRVWRVE